MIPIFFVITFLVTLIICSVKKPDNFPPGPRWLPIVGCVPYLKKTAKAIRAGQHIVLEELSKQWNTNVLGLKLGEQLVVSVSTYPIIKDVFENEAFDARPDNFFGRLRQIGSGPGITCAEGDFWIEQKKFITKHLRKVGLGKSLMEHKIGEELYDVLHEIDADNLNVQVGKLLQPAVINLIWSLIAGHRITKDDPKYLTLINLIDKRGDAFDMAGGTLSNYPWLRFIAPEKVGYNLIKTMNFKMKNFIMESIIEHHSTWTEGSDSDLMYSFISRMKRKDGESFTDDQLLMVSVDLFVAGAHSTSGTLDFALLMMLLHPDVQRKVQNELGAHFPDNHNYQYSDRHRLPYTQAVLSEVERFCHVLPIAGSRRATKNTRIEQYSIPKGTTVLINLYSVFMSKDIWGDPDNFRPDRFLNEKGKLMLLEEFIPFSTGRRRCLGEPLARTFIFIFFVELLKRYRIEPLDKNNLPTRLPRVGIVSLPQPYSATFLPRHD
ncbi:hypothetical protein FQR65_LT19304 [Abscondita terminalis]|nr:hypothetical protein FQR65_LT19304 [Abscondita terminalis]